MYAGDYQLYASCRIIFLWCSWQHITRPYHICRHLTCIFTTITFSLLISSTTSCTLCIPYPISSHMTQLLTFFFTFFCQDHSAFLKNPFREVIDTRMIDFIMRIILGYRFTTKITKICTFMHTRNTVGNFMDHVITCVGIVFFD